MRALLVAAALLLGSVAWLVATEPGLQATLALAQRLTHGALSVGAAQGALTRAFTLQDLRYAAPRVEVRATRVAAQLWWPDLLRGRLHLDDCAVDGLSVDVTPAPRPETPAAPLTVRAPIPIAIERGVLRGFALRVGEVRWRLPEAQLGASWLGTEMAFQELRARTEEAGPVALRGTLAIENGLLRLEDVALSAPVALHAQGTVSLGETDGDVTLRWRELTLPAPLDGVPLSSREGTLRLQGRWARYAALLDARIAVLGLDGALRARTHGTLHSLDVDDALLRTLGGSLALRGTLDWRDGVRAQGTLRLAGLDPGTELPGWKGRLNGEARVQALWRAQQLALDFDAELKDSQLRGQPVALRAVGRTRQKQVELDTLSLSALRSTLAARGRLWPSFDLAGDWRTDDLGALWSGLAGAAKLHVALGGTPEAPRLQARGGGEHWLVQRRPVGAVTLDLDFAPQGVSRLHAVARQVQTRRSPWDITLDAGGTRRRHQATLLVDRRSGDTRLALRGTWDGDAWRGSLTQLSIGSPAIRDWELEEHAALNWRAGTFSNQPACIRSGDSRACVQATLSAPRQRIAFRLRDFDLKRARPLLPQGWELHSRATGTAVFELRAGSLYEVRADLDATAGEVRSGNLKFPFGPGSLRVQPDGGGLSAALQLAPAGGTVRAQLRIGALKDIAAAPMRGSLSLHLPDLSFLTLLTQEIGRTRGVLDAQLAVSGTPAAPALDGDLKVPGGAIQLATPGIELTELSALVRSGPVAPISLAIDAKSGGGPVHLQGQLQSVMPHVLGKLRLWGERVEFMNTTAAHVFATPDLQLVLEQGAAHLTGTLQVPRADITPRNLGGRGSGPSADQVMVSTTHDEPQPALVLTSDVQIALGPNVRFDGVGLTTRLTGSLRAFDEPGRPTRALGELRLEGGRYKAYGQDLTIESGRLIFNGGAVTEPGIYLKAYRKPRDDITVGLVARGQVAAPEFSLYSEPAMTQEEQLSWLVLGRSLQQTLASGQGAALAAPALSLGLGGGNFLAERYGGKLGLDEVSVGTKPGDAADQARFTIGKYLSPKLFVSYGVGLFQPGNFFRLQYDLGRGFKLAGESGVQQGGDLLYTIER
ncbi:MAG TPA: translocation/assembly module TamB domain-containing protein [Candidatus Binatia bacterium]|nr:translocation/assembly module TamB domain-containing protein [Candidatus Binatia bacterium]